MSVCLLSEPRSTHVAWGQLQPQTSLAEERPFCSFVVDLLSRFCVRAVLGEKGHQYQFSERVLRDGGQSSVLAFTALFPAGPKQLHLELLALGRCMLILVGEVNSSLKS